MLRRLFRVPNTTKYRIAIQLPINTKYTYRFYERRIDTSNIGNPNHGVALTSKMQGQTTTRLISPLGKRLLCYTSLQNPQLFWRQGAGPFTQIALNRIAAGRTAGDGNARQAGTSQP